MEGSKNKKFQDIATAIKRWNIQNLLEDKKLKQVVKNDWKKFRCKHNYLMLINCKNNLNKKVEWFQKSVIEMLNNHIKGLKVSTYLKQW